MLHCHVSTVGLNGQTNNGSRESFLLFLEVLCLFLIQKWTNIFSCEFQIENGIRHFIFKYLTVDNIQIGKTTVYCIYIYISPHSFDVKVTIKMQTVS